MSQHKKEKIEDLKKELEIRFQKLVILLSDNKFPYTVEIDSSKLRVAVDDFRSILNEIRKLK